MADTHFLMGERWSSGYGIRFTVWVVSSHMGSNPWQGSPIAWSDATSVVNPTTWGGQVMADNDSGHGVRR